MDNKRIKDHPPWYARGTPVTNTRDGPAMALNDKLLFAICRGPSGEGRGGGGSQQLAVGSWQSAVGSRKMEVGRQKTEVGSWQMAVGSRKSEVGSRKPEVGRQKSEDRSRESEDRSRKSGVGRQKTEVARLPVRQHQYGGNEISRGKPKGKTRRWLTLKTTFFNMQNSVYGQWYGVLGRKMGGEVGSRKSEDGSREWKKDRSRKSGDRNAPTLATFTCMSASWRISW